MITRLRELPWPRIVVLWLVIWNLQGIAFLLGVSLPVIAAGSLLYFYIVYLTV